jgi:hypothetical protein
VRGAHPRHPARPLARRARRLRPRRGARHHARRADHRVLRRPDDVPTDDASAWHAAGAAAALAAGPVRGRADAGQRGRGTARADAPIWN